MSADRAVPGAALLHPWPLLAAAAIVVNDVWLRHAYPGLVSGKLSGLGVCFLLPVTLVATWEWARAALWRSGWRATRRAAVVACVVSAAYYAALETVPLVGRLHEAAMRAVLGGAVTVTRDPTDLVCLACTGLALAYLVRRGVRAPQGGTA